MLNKNYINEKDTKISTIKDVNEQFFKAIEIIKGLSTSNYKKIFKENNLFKNYDYQVGFDYYHEFQKIAIEFDKLKYSINQANMNKLTLLILGDNNVGKTTLASKLNNDYCNLSPEDKIRYQTIKLFGESYLESDFIDKIIIQGPNTPSKDNDFLKKNWNTLIILIAIESITHKMNLTQNQKELLSILRQNNCTDRIIFIFTKITSHLRKNFPSRRSMNYDQKLKIALSHLNASSNSFIEELEKSFPKASYIFYDENSAFDQLYYHKHTMECIYNVSELPKQGFYIKINDQSIDYLRQLMDEIAIFTKNRMILVNQQKFLLAMKRALRSMDVVLLQNETLIEKQIPNFLQPYQSIYEDAKARLKEEIIVIFDFDSTQRSGRIQSLLKIWCQKTLVEINNSDQETRFFQIGYANFLKNQFINKFNHHTNQTISNIINRILASVHIKLLTQIQNSNFDFIPVNNLSQFQFHHQISTYLNSKWANNFSLEEVSSPPPPSSSSSSSNSWFSFIPNIKSVVRTTFSTGISQVYWNRQTILENASKKFYELIINDQELKVMIIHLGITQIQSAWEIFQYDATKSLKNLEKDMPGYTQYHQTKIILNNIEKSILNLKTFYKC